tara:strand:+ start:1438 stop:1935 length:498 start_codon:yes stop_codon:yes gene_type:complete
MSNVREHIGFEHVVLQRYRSDLAAWLGRMDFNVGLTLNFNQPSSLSHARKKVGDLFFRVDRKLIGARFHRKPKLRTAGVFFFEHVDTNIHCHGLIRVRDEAMHAFKELFPDDDCGLWSNVCSSGSHHISAGADMETAAYYITKEQKPWTDPATTLWLDEFHSPGQ